MAKPEQLKLPIELDVYPKALDYLGKTGRIVRECLVNQEPFFVLRAKDLFSVMAVRNYLKLVEEYGPYDPEFDEGVMECIQQMREWQQNNPGQVKYPD